MIKGRRQEILIQLGIEGLTDRRFGGGTSGFSDLEAEILHWGCDDVGIPLTDSNAVILDAFTTLEPDRLMSFTLDMSHEGLEVLQRPTSNCLWGFPNPLRADEE